MKVMIPIAHPHQRPTFITIIIITKMTRVRARLVSSGPTASTTTTTMVVPEVRGADSGNMENVVDIIITVPGVIAAEGYLRDHAEMSTWEKFSKATTTTTIKMIGSAGK